MNETKCRVGQGEWKIRSEGISKLGLFPIAGILATYQVSDKARDKTRSWVYNWSDGLDYNKLILIILIIERVLITTLILFLLVNISYLIKE